MFKLQLLLTLLILVIVFAVDSTKEDGGLIVQLRNRVGFISVVTEIGEPSQEIELLLDTGSSISWVMSESNPYCNHDQNSQMPIFNCETYGTLNTNISSSFNNTKNPFSVTYFDSTTASGNFATDKLRIPTIEGNGRVILDSFEFGIGENANSSIGILGLGIPHFKKAYKGSGSDLNLESNENKHTTYERRNIVFELKRNNVIESNLFGIWLDERTNHGEMTIGAIDEAKFEGPLVSTKFINYENPGDPIQRYQTAISDISLNIGPFSHGNIKRAAEQFDLFQLTPQYQGTFIGALVDTGSVHTHLPVGLYEELVSTIRVQYQSYGDLDGYQLVPCFDGNDGLDPANHTLSFRFNKASFNIPLRSFLKRVPNDSRMLLKSGRQPDSCILGIQPQYDNVTILGQALFRSIYTVFDLDQMQLLMAPAVYTNKRSLCKVSLEYPLKSIDDGVIDFNVTHSFYDPLSDFVMDTRGGYYKTISTSSSIRNRYNWLHSLICLLLIAIS